MENAIRVAVVSVSHDKESEDDRVSLGGIRRHCQSTKGPQRRASTIEKSDLVSTVGDKIYD